MYMYIHVYIYMYICTCIYIYIYICIYVCVCLDGPQNLFMCFPRVLQFDAVFGRNSTGSASNMFG